MFFITTSSMFSFTIFFFFLYFTFILSVLIYLLPILNNIHKFISFKNKTNFVLINWFDINWVLLLPYLIFLVQTLTWSSPSLSIWFGHLVLSLFNFKIMFLITFFFVIILSVIMSHSYFSSNDIYDYVLTILNFFYWILMLFFANSIFTSIFVIEVTSTLIFMLIITSSYTTTFFYKNSNITEGHLLQKSTPSTYIQSLLFFFWVSLISSLNLFFFLILFFMKIFTFDWFLYEHIFLFLISSNSYPSIFSIGAVWFIFIFCFFLKCGLAPFFIWKPTFFKGLPIHTLFFYICFYYFSLFLFFINILLNSFSEIFFFFSFLFTILLIFSILILFTILCESYYLKIFLAMSSILNSVLVVLALIPNHGINFIFFL